MRFFPFLKLDKSLNLSKLRITEMVEMKVGSIVKINQEGSDNLYFITEFSGLGHAKLETFANTSSPAPGDFIRDVRSEFCADLRVVGHIDPSKKVKKVFWLQDDSQYHRPSNNYELSIDSFFEHYNSLPHKDIRYSPSDISFSESHKGEYKVAEYYSDSVDMLFLLVFPSVNISLP